MIGDETTLTERQIEVLMLREKGLSQTEISKRLGTTKANICSIEKRARENIQKAENTLRVFRFIKAPIWITVEAGSNLVDVPKVIFSEANKHGIRIPHTGPEIVNVVKESARTRIREWHVLKPLEIAVTKEGEVIVKD